MRKFHFLTSYPKLKIFYSLLFLIAIFYLLLPPPPIPQIRKAYPFQDGDIGKLTGQPQGVYFTNLSQKEVNNFYQENFSRSPFLNIPLFTQKIDYQPKEYSKEILNDDIADLTSFLTEFSHPWRESIIIQGFGEVESGKRIQFTPENDKKYNLRIVVYYIESPFWARILVLIGIFILTPIILKRMYSAIVNNWEIVRKNSKK